jgi:hypothetical protein
MRLKFLSKFLRLRFFIQARPYNGYMFHFILLNVESDRWRVSAIDQLDWLVLFNFVEMACNRLSFVHKGTSLIIDDAKI